MKKLILISVLLYAFLTITQSLSAGQIVFGWNKINPAGAIYDMQFLPDGNRFLMAAGNEMQIADAATGSILQRFKGIIQSGAKFEFTPDSTRIVIANVNKIEVRNVQDMSLISSDSFKLGADSLDQHNNKLYFSITAIVVDPIKPLTYIVVEKTNSFLEPGMYVDTIKVIAYNYLSMQQVTNLSPGGYINSYMPPQYSTGNTFLSASKDGKYLAALTYGESHIYVWSLDSMKLIRDFKLCDFYGNQGALSGQPVCIQFSEINTDNIYFSGEFPKYKDDWQTQGLFKYNILSNSIIDTLLNPNYPNGYFILFDNELKGIFGLDTVRIINLITNKSEAGKRNSDSIPFGEKIIYSIKNGYFIGYTHNWNPYAVVRYDSTTDITDNNKIISTLYPNPTSNVVNITLNCLSPVINYQIYNINGQLLKIGSIPIQNNKIQINFASYPLGIYLLKLTCGNLLLSYKIVKE